MTRFVADEFFSDHRVTQAKELLLQTLAEHQRRLTGVRPADPGLKQTYDEMLAEFGLLLGIAILPK